MSNVQNFRTAFHGFNRQDVVSYIEYINNRHNSEIQQLNNQLQSLQSKGDNSQLQEKLAAAEARIQELEAALAQQGGAAVNCTEQELEAYRRAERAERVAQERSQQICQQANAVLADAGVQVDSAAAAIDDAAQKLDAQLQTYKVAVENAKATLHDAASALGAIAPQSE